MIHRKYDLSYKISKSNLVVAPQLVTVTGLDNETGEFMNETNERSGTARAKRVLNRTRNCH